MIIFSVLLPNNYSLSVNMLTDTSDVFKYIGKYPDKLRIHRVKGSWHNVANNIEQVFDFLCLAGKGYDEYTIMMQERSEGLGSKVISDWITFDLKSKPK